MMRRIKTVIWIILLGLLIILGSLIYIFKMPIGGRQPVRLPDESPQFKNPVGPPKIKGPTGPPPNLP